MTYDDLVTLSSPVDEKKRKQTGEKAGGSGESVRVSGVGLSYQVKVCRVVAIVLLLIL